MYKVKVALNALAWPSDIGQIRTTIDRKTIAIDPAIPYPNMTAAMYLDGKFAAIPNIVPWQAPFPIPQQINNKLQVQKP